MAKIAIVYHSGYGHTAKQAPPPSPAPPRN